MERMTVSMLAVIHGDSDVLCDSETLEAESREELLDAWIGALRGLVQDAEAVRRGE